MLFIYPLPQPDTNRTAFQISSVPIWPKNRTAIQITSVSTWQKSGWLFRYPLFLLDKNRDSCSYILCSFSALDQEYYSNILCFYFAERKTSLQIFFISTRHKSGMSFKYPLFLLDLRLGLLLRYPLFLLDKNRDCCSDILCCFSA